MSKIMSTVSSFVPSHFAQEDILCPIWQLMLSEFLKNKSLRFKKTNLGYLFKTNFNGFIFIFSFILRTREYLLFYFLSWNKLSCIPLTQSCSRILRFEKIEVKKTNWWVLRLFLIWKNVLRFQKSQNDVL